MSTPVSVPQINKLLALLGYPSGKKFQHLLANGDLLKQMADADLTRVDRSAFGAMLASTSTPIVWRPVSEYADKITEWNKLRSWGLTETQITTFAKTLVDPLVDHLDLLHPTGISLWLGRNLSYNWNEATACLKHEVEALGKQFSQYMGTKQVSFFSGSEQTGGHKLTVALLDLATYWDPAMTPNEVRKTKKRLNKRLPGLEVVWLLALSPQVCLAIDYETIPGLMAAGLTADFGTMPCFACDSKEAFVYNFNAGFHQVGNSVVAFRE